MILNNVCELGQKYVKENTGYAKRSRFTPKFISKLGLTLSWNDLKAKFKLKYTVARRLLKLAIKDELGPFKPISEIDFVDFKSVIKNSLSLRLIKLDIPNTDILIEYMLEHLTTNQSLVTLIRV